MSRLRDRKDKPPLPHQMRRHRLTDRDPQKDQAAGEKALRVQAAEFRADIGESVRTRHVIIGALPCVIITSMNPDATMATDAISDMLRRMGAQQKVEEIWCERISCLVNVVHSIGFCVSRFPSEKICSTERRKIGIKSLRQILQGYVSPNKNSGERVDREASFKSVNLMSVVLAHPGLRRGHKTKPRTKKDAPADVA